MPDTDAAFESGAAADGEVPPTETEFVGFAFVPFAVSVSVPGPEPKPGAGEDDGGDITGISVVCGIVSEDGVEPGADIDEEEEEEADQGSCMEFADAAARHAPEPPAAAESWAKPMLSGSERNTE